VNLNVLLRGQSNAVILGMLKDAGGTSPLTAAVQTLLGFDGITDTVTLLFQWQDPNGRNTAVGGTALIGDWLTPAGTGWQAGTLEQGLLGYIAALPASLRASPTVELWLHNEYDSGNAGLTAAQWQGAVRADAALVRAAFGNPVPYVFVEPIPYVSGTDAGAQAIREGMAALAADPAFDASLTAPTDDLNMDAVVFGGGGHMSASDAALVADRAARAIAAEFAAYARPGSPVANGLDDTGPIAVQAVATGPRTLSVALHLDAAAGLAALDADAATGLGWTVIAGTTVLDATGVAIGPGNTLVLQFAADLPSGARLFYGYGNAHLVGADGGAHGNAIYDTQGVPLGAPAAGLLIGAAAIAVGAVQVGGAGTDTIVAGAAGDTITGGQGNDYLVAGAGADVFRISLGDGNDWIDGFTPGSDRIAFHVGIAAADLRTQALSIAGVAGLGVFYGSGGDGIFLANVAALLPGDLVFAQPAVPPGALILGSTGDDKFGAGAGGDTLIGGLGSDYLVGGGGADVFGFQRGDGYDWVDNFTPGTDRLVFAGGLGVGDVSTSAGSFLGVDGLFVSYGGSDAVFLARVAALLPGDIGFGPLPGAPFFVVGGQLESAAAYAGPVAGLQYQHLGGAGAESVRGTAAGDLIQAGGANDTLRGGAGHDSLAGGAGRDVAVFGGNAADTTLVHNADGSWTATGPDGTDTLSGIELARFDDGDRPLRAVAHDFTGTGSSDILFRATGGELALWQFEQGAYAGGGALGSPDTAWHIAGSADFDGDLRADILWRHADGTLALWRMDGTAYVGGGSFATLDAAWQVAGLGDLNGDGRADILFRNTDGTLAQWQMDGTAYLGGGSFGAVDSAWQVAGLGDFNGDGRDDILFRNTDGSVSLWQMNGLASAGGGTIGNPGAEWSVAGIGDFNADGRADILWRSTGGALAEWWMDGTTVIGGGSVADVDPAWSVAEVGDFNGDGRADLLWRHTDGSLALWTMDGLAATTTASLYNPGSAWQVT